MGSRWLAACGVGVLLAAPASAQSPLSVPEPEPAPVPYSIAPDPPTMLPPLLPVVPTEPVPPSTVPRGPGGNYDPGYLYLPDRAPDGPKLPPCPCRPLGTWWVAPELALAWSAPAQVPPLVRLGVPGPRGRPVPGPVAFGGESLPAPFRAGFALNAGVWLDRCHRSGIDANFFYLAQGGYSTTILSPGALLLPTWRGNFPLSDPAAGYVGTFQFGLGTRYTTADVNYRHNFYCETNTRLDLLVGYRYARLGEDIDLYGKRLGPEGAILRFRDQAWATNNFNGGQIGLAGEYRFEGGWYLGGTGTIALGALNADTDLYGKFRTDGTVIPYGFYSRPDVAGVREHSRFAVMPVLKLAVGRQLGEHARIYLGYQFQYLNNLTRAGDILDPTPTLPPGNPALAVLPWPATGRRDVNTSDFWVQSVNLGIDLRY